MSIEIWEPENRGQRDIIDGWVTQLTSVVHLAEVIADTDFVPKAFRDDAPAIAAVILAGRELGIGPMTSLQHLFVVHGRPGMSAQLMRAMVLSRGHHLRIPKKTGFEARIIGRRAGELEGTEQEVVWTMDYANQAGLPQRNPDVWKKYPRAMLLARATGELCRDKFPDAIGGMAYTYEELLDIEPGGFTPEPAPKPRATRTMRRSVEAAPAGDSPPQAPAAPARGGDAAPPPSPPRREAPPLSNHEQPPLPLIPTARTSDRAPHPLATGPVPGGGPDDDEPMPPPPEVEDGPVAITNAQRAMLMAQLSDLGLRDPPKLRHDVLTGLAGRRITGTNQLTRDQASAIIDTLARRLEEQLSAEQLEDLIAAGTPE
jgi:hypothetical protein